MKGEGHSTRAIKLYGLDDIDKDSAVTVGIILQHRQVRCDNLLRLRLSDRFATAEQHAVLLQLVVIQTCDYSIPR